MMAKATAQCCTEDGPGLKLKSSYCECALLEEEDV